MTDLNALVEAIADAAPAAPFRLRLGTIVSVAANGTATITVGGGTNQVSGVKVAASCCPIPNATCWVATDGRDMFVISTLAPSGPAYGTMRQNAAQSIPNAAWTALDFTTRTDVISTGVTVGNTGLTVVVPGLYTISAAGGFAANATGQRHLVIYKNGSPLFHAAGGNAAAGSDVQRLSGSATFKLAIGDLINAYVYQTSTAALNTQIGAGYNLLTMAWVGPSV